MSDGVEVLSEFAGEGIENLNSALLEAVGHFLQANVDQMEALKLHQLLHALCRLLLLYDSHNRLALHDATN